MPTENSQSISRQGYVATLVGTVIGAMVGFVLGIVLVLGLVGSWAAGLFLSCGDACQSTTVNHSITAFTVLAFVLSGVIGIVSVGLGCYFGLKIRHHTYAKETAMLFVKLVAVLYFVEAVLYLVTKSYTSGSILGWLTLPIAYYSRRKVITKPPIQPIISTDKPSSLE